jgi:tetratricopeptide (TPR) repeat protein
VKLAEPWESLRVLIMPKRSEEDRLMKGWGAELYSKYREDENYKRALFYATLALEKAFSDYRTALRKLEEAFDVYRKDVEEREKVVQRVEVGEEPFKKVVYVADLGQIKQLAEDEEAAFESALSALRKRLNEYAVKYGLGDLLNVEEGVAREMAEAEHRELSKFSNVNFGTKALAALIAYREHALGRRSAFGVAAWY